MATIHGNWQISDSGNGGKLFVWADTWGNPLPEEITDRHPFALDAKAIAKVKSNLPLKFPSPNNLESRNFKPQFTQPSPK